jgi:hypothetical protein
MMHSVTDLATKRWRRYGKDRVYVTTSSGQQVGWLDLVDGSRHLELPELGAAFAAALQPFVLAAPEADVNLRTPQRPVAAPSRTSHLPGRTWPRTDQASRCA